MDVVRVGELTPEAVLEMQPRVRVELMRRLNRLWEYCEEELDPSVGKPDVRKAQLGLQVIKETRTLMMLDKSRLPTPEPEVDPAALTPRARDVLALHAQLLELEARDSS